jgi:hypothetical protein
MGKALLFSAFKIWRNKKKKVRQMCISLLWNLGMKAVSSRCSGTDFDAWAKHQRNSTQKSLKPLEGNLRPHWDDP